MGLGSSNTNFISPFNIISVSAISKLPLHQLNYFLENKYKLKSLKPSAFVIYIYSVMCFGFSLQLSFLLIRMRQWGFDFYYWVVQNRWKGYRCTRVENPGDGVAQNYACGVKAFRKNCQGATYFGFYCILLEVFLKIFVMGSRFTPLPTLTPPVCIYGKGNKNIAGPKSKLKGNGSKITSSKG